MKTYIKNLLSIAILISFLFLGLIAGSNVSYASGPYNGWVCPDNDDSSGQCERNYNQTKCTWSGSGCDTSPDVRT